MKNLLAILSLSLAIGSVTAAENYGIFADKNLAYEGKCTQTTGGQAVLPVNIRNLGTNPISTFDYSYYWDNDSSKTYSGSYNCLDGNTVSAYHFYDFVIKGAEGSSSYSAVCDLVLNGPIATDGYHTVTVNLNKINGVDNAAGVQTAKYSMKFATAPTFDRKELREFSYIQPGAAVTYRGYDKKTGYAAAININTTDNPELTNAEIVGVKISNLPASGIGFLRTSVVPADATSPYIGILHTPQQIALAKQTGTDAVAYFPERVTFKDFKSLNIITSFAITDLNEATKKPIATSAMTTQSAQSCIMLKADSWGLSKSDWENKGVSDNYGAAQITVYYVKPPERTSCRFHYSTNEAVPYGPKVTRHQANRPFKLPLYVRNDGTNPLTSLGYEYTIDGQNKQTGEVDLERVNTTIAPGVTGTVWFDVCGIPAGSHELNFTLTQANGEYNDTPAAEEYRSNSYRLGFVEVDQAIPKEAKSFTYIQPGAEVKYTGYGTKQLYVASIVLDSIHAPELMGKYVIGAKVDNVVTNGTDNFAIWHSNTDRKVNLPFYYDREDEVWVEPKDGSIQAIFTTPCKVGNSEYDRAVGFRFDITDINEQSNAPVAYTTSRVEGAPSLQVVKQNTNPNSQNNFNDYSSMGAGMITVYYMDNAIEYDGDYSLDITRIQPYDTIQANAPFSIVFNIMNTGKAVKGARGIMTVEGHDDQVLDAPAWTPPVARATTCTMTYPGLPIGHYKCTFHVDSIEGHPNSSPNNLVEFEIDVADRFADFPTDTKKIEYFDLSNGSCLGQTGASHAEAAMLVKEPLLKNAKIIGLDSRYVCKDYRGYKGSGFNFFATRQIGTGAIPEEDCTPTPVWNGRATTLLNNPIEIGEDGVYVGFLYDFNTPADGWAGTYWYSAPYDTGKKYYLRDKRSGKWQSYTEYGQPIITVYIQGETPDGLLVTKQLNANTLAVPDGTFPVELKVVNYSGTEINNLSYTYENKDNKGEKSVDLSKPLSGVIGLAQTVILPAVGAPSSGTADTVKVAINKIDGRENMVPQDPQEVDIKLALFAPVNRPFMEEGTGTLCGWCPRGSVALAEMGRRYPDFVCAAYHSYKNTDPMFVTYELPWNTTAFPCATINRIGNIDPFFGTHDDEDMGIEQDYLKYRGMVAPADIEMATQWNEDSTEINVTTKVKFALEESQRQYKIGYLTTIDDLSNPGDEDWIQLSGYTKGCSYSVYPTLKPLCDGEIDNNIFNHVVCDTLGYMGVEGSLPSQVEPGVEYTHNFTIPLGDNEIVSYGELKDVRVIAFLVDDTRTVRNSVSVHAGQKSSRIEELSVDMNAPVTYYDLMGRMVKEPQHGIFIKRQGNKSTKVIL